MNKYYYQHGRCIANSYLSFNPVLYEETDTENEYKKIRMACNCIQKGECVRETTYQLFIDAPEIVRDDGVNLLNKKL